jgi:hypothetical protein
MENKMDLGGIYPNPTSKVAMKNSRKMTWLWLFVAGLLTVQPALAVPPPGGVAPIEPPTGGFGIDGNLLANSPTANIGDWLLNTNAVPGVGRSVLDAIGAPLDSTRTFHFIDPYNDTSNDRIFTGGDKWLDDPTTWGWTSGKPSSKTDINNTLLHLATDTNGHVWAVLSADRFSTSGDSYIDFELLQNLLTRNADGTFNSAGPNGGRTTNDILLSLAFTGGGKVADFFAWRWAPNGSGGFTYTDMTAMLPVGRVYVALNSNTVVAPYDVFGSTSYAPNAFAEAAIDLTALLGNFDQCVSFGFKTIMIKTKASASSSASIEDFIDPIQYNLNIGPAANAGADQVRCRDGAETAFPLTGSAANGVQPITSTTWSVVNGSATIDNPISLTTVARVSSASATLRLTVNQANGCTKSDDIVLTVQQPPVVEVTGQLSVCPRTTNTYVAPAGMTSYAWSVTGNGSISGPANQATVKVIAGTACGQGYNVSLNVSSGVCTVSSVREVLVTDSTQPVLVIPQDRVLDCPADTRTNSTGVATATDGCSLATVTYNDSVTNGCGFTQIIARTWIATDECGNAMSQVQMITVRDTTPPVLVSPPDVTLECGAANAPSDTGMATATDGCGSASVSFSDSISIPCPGSQIITRTWTAVDLCGNTFSKAQIITMSDTKVPVLTLPPSVTLDCPADTSTNANGVATAIDACGSVVIAYADAVTNGCGSSQTILRRWTATDDCGNIASAVQTISVRDITAPVIAALPEPTTINCPATPSFAQATAADTCDESVTLTFKDVTTAGSCAGNYSVTRTWTATDDCGNSSTASQTINVQDITAPVIAALPAPTTINCPATPGFAQAVATDTCDQSVTLTFNDVTTPGACAGNYSVTRTWTATDDCGNFSTASQTINVQDITAPTIAVLPAPTTINCPAIPNFAQAVATDACDQSVTLAFNDVTTPGSCAGNYSVTRTWTAVDDCGNTSTDSQTINVQDITAPVIAALPAPTTINCPATPGFAQAVATDACDQNVTLTFNDVTTPGSCAGNYSVTRTWTAMDDCGNTSTASQTINVQDITVPTIAALPAPTTINCPATPSFAQAVATDACDQSVTLTFKDVTTPGSCPGNYSVTRTWTAVDDCGNSSTASQTINVQDITAPALVLPANVVQEAPGDTRTNVTGVATAFDACGFATVSYSEVVSNSCGLSKTIWRLWTAVDQCGNTTNGLQTIVVRDTKSPVVQAPAITVQCVGDVPAPYATLAAFLAAGGKATDNSSNGMTFALTSDSGLVGSCPGIVTRVYRVTDACGNYADASQKITVDDTTPPAIACAPSLTVACNASLDPAITGFATATDNCDPNVTVTHSDVLVPSSYDINWYASDPVANSAPYLPTYLKFGPASLVGPTNGRAADPLRNAVAYGPTAGQLDALTSLGGEPMVLGQIVPFQAVIDVSGGPGPERGTIEFTASWSTHTTSNDEFGYDKKYKVYCAFVDSADIGSIDPHANAKVDLYNSTLINTGTIDEKIQGTFRVSGLDTGDRVIVEVWVVLMDTQPNHVGGTIASDLVSAQKVLNPPQPITTGTKTISIGSLNKLNQLPPPQSQPPLPPQPPQPPVAPGFVTSVIDRTWTATDDCGNSSTCVQRFTVRDATAPSLVVPTNVVLECPSGTGTNICGVATAQDSCGTVTITYSDTVTNTCGISKIVFRLWTASDEWGNSTNAMQTITVIDSTPPTLSTCTNKTIAAGQPLVFDAPTATDAGGTAIVHLVGTTTNTLSGGSYSVTSTWCATDACGNQCAMQSQTITVLAPSLTRLTIAIAGPNSVLLRWPVAAIEHRLEYAPTPDAARWYPVAVTPINTNGEWRVYLPKTGLSQFFRLTDTPPYLEGQKLSGGNLRLTWPTAPSGFQLEASETMASGSWIPVVITPGISNALNHVNVPATGAKKFFRLKK